MTGSAFPPKNASRRVDFVVLGEAVLEMLELSI